MMRLCAIVFIVLMLSAVCIDAQSSKYATLVFDKKYTQLNKQLHENNIPIAERDIWQAILYSVFGQPSRSNELISKILSDKPSITDSIRYLLLDAQNNNFMQLFDYRSASETHHCLLQRFSAFYKPDELDDELEWQKIWDALSNTPPQQVIKDGNVVELPIKKDPAHMRNIPVKEGDSTYQFVLDSGAGLSCTTDSFAKVLHLQILDSPPIKVKSTLTGVDNDIKLGVAPQLQMGSIILKNVVFLIFSNEAFSSPLSHKRQYHVNAILGLPVIKELGTVTISRENVTIESSVPAEIKEPNMALFMLTQCIYLQYKGEDLPFTFDTGAEQSLLNRLFYIHYKSIVDELGATKTLVWGSAGGFKIFKIKRMHKISFGCSDNVCTLKRINVKTEKKYMFDDIFYGNLGWDLIPRNKSLTINFTESTIRLND